jgi:hypothetical protein
MLETITIAKWNPAERPAAEDCRAHERYPCELPTTCQPPSFLGNEEIKWEGKLHDISAGGVGVVLSRRFEPGAVLSIELSDRGGNPFTLLGRVVHVRLRREGRYLLGCAFVSQLSAEEVETLRNLSEERAAQQAEMGGGYLPPVAPSTWVSARQSASA